MNSKTITATSTLLVSLAAYHYAKQTGRDATPLVMVGGFLGALLGELIAAGNGNDGTGGQRLLK